MSEKRHHLLVYMLPLLEIHRNYDQLSPLSELRQLHRDQRVFIRLEGSAGFY